METERDVVEFEGGEKVLDRSVKALAILAGISLMWLMALVCYSVFMRRVFNAPPLGGGDLASVSLVPVVFWVLPIAAGPAVILPSTSFPA